MANLKKEYQKGDLTVTWEPGKCMHSEKCWRGLIEVFNPKNKPRINVDGATKERIMEQVDQCPSGALGYYLGGAHRAVEAQNDTKITVSKNGPYLVEAPVEIVDH